LPLSLKEHNVTGLDHEKLFIFR